MKIHLKRLIPIICFFIICLVIFLKFIYSNSPEKAVSLYNKKYNYNNNKILKKSTINEHSKLFISIDNTTIYIDIINSNFLNHWKVTTRFSINDIYNHQINRCEWDTLRYSPQVGYKGIYFGIINDNHVKRVTINNKNCTVEKLKPNLYLWYRFDNPTGFKLV